MFTNNGPWKSIAVRCTAYPCLIRSHLLVSLLDRNASTLCRTELLELRRRRALCSHGSEGCSPVDFANALRISVSETTPISLPDSSAPAIAAAGTEATGAAGGIAPGATSLAVELCDDTVGIAGVGRGDGGGPESTTHIRCDLVATSLATV